MTDSNLPPTTPAVTDEYPLEYYKSQMATLLNREKELQETQRHLQRVVSTLLSLQKISRFLKAATGLNEGLEYVLKALVTETNYERAVIMMPQENSVLVLSQGYSEDEKQAMSGVPKEALDSFLTQLKATKESAFLVHPGQGNGDAVIMPLLKFDTCLLALITDNDRAVGFIAAGYSPEQAAYFAPVLKLEKDDTSWFDELAHQISSTIVNLTLLDSLKAEQARLSASINSLVLGFMIVDLQHKVTFSNEAINTILGVERIQTMQDIAGHFEDIDIIQLGDQAVAQRKPVEIKEVLCDKKILRLFFGPVIKDTGVIGYIFLVADITEAKSVERSREEFFSIASHELRTPLTTIRGNASMLLDYYGDALPDADAKQMLADIKGAALRLIKIVNDFLQISRLEQKQLPFHLEATDITSIIQEVITEFKPIADAKNLPINYSQPTAAKVVADPGWVKEIFASLISNAINYTREGHIDIEAVEQSGKLTVRVKDTGAGITQRNQSLLFRKFQQAGDMLTRDADQSTGLGLYTSKLRVEAMEGTIQLEESTPDQGSVFSFTLPLVPTPEG